MNEKLQPTSQKPRWRFSQAQEQRWEILLSQPPIKKIKYYRSVIDITFISDIVPHMVAI